MKPKPIGILPSFPKPSNGTSADQPKQEDLNNHPLFKKSIPTDKQELASQKEFDLVGFNLSAEKQFIELLCWLLADGELSPREAIQEASFELNISPETTKRYLSKHTARRAQFRIDQDGLIRCKKHQH